MAWRSIQRLLKTLLAIVAGALCVSCAHSPAGEIATERADVHLFYQQGILSAELNFRQDTTAVFFPRSDGIPRSTYWNISSRIGSVQRFGNFDGIEFSRPVRSASFEVVPTFEDPEHEYAPFLQLEGGRLAVFTGQFEFLTSDSGEDISDLKPDLSNWQGHQYQLSMEAYSDRNGNLGDVKRGKMLRDLSVNPGQYIYFGRSSEAAGETLTSIIDTRFPNWVQRHLKMSFTRGFSNAQSFWSNRSISPPQAIVSYGGSEGAGLHLKGGALGTEQLVFRLKGDALLRPNAKTKYFIDLLIHHELSHSFQAHRFLSLQNEDHSWITEGSAEFASLEISAETSAKSSDAREIYLQRARNRCIDYLKKGSLITARSRGDSRAHYECGLMIWTAFHETIPASFHSEFWRQLLDRARESDDSTYSSEDAFFVAAQMGVGARKIELSRQMVCDKVGNPASLIANLLATNDENLAEED